MVDIKRRRQRPLALGMGAVSDVDKPEALRAVIGQLQENIEALWRRINELAVVSEEVETIPEVEEPPSSAPVQAIEETVECVWQAYDGP